MSSLPRPGCDGYSPYGLDIGMKPQCKLDALWRRLPPESRPTTTCVGERQWSMKAVQAQVQDSIYADVERYIGAGWGPAAFRHLGG